jgi:hypothetical protein
MEIDKQLESVRDAPEAGKKEFQDQIERMKEFRRKMGLPEPKAVYEGIDVSKPRQVPFVPGIKRPFFHQ